MKYSDNPFNHGRIPRHDTTGRHSPLHIPRIESPWYYAVLGGVFIGCILALMLWAAI